MSAKHDPDQDPYCLDSSHDSLAAQLAALGDAYDETRAENERLRRERDDARQELEDTKNNRLVSAIFGHHKGAPKPFCLYRRQDVSGVSGTGVVAVGCEFPDGLVVLRWTSAWPTSVAFHERGIESVKAIHGHDGRTEVVWLSDEFEPLAEAEVKLGRALEVVEAAKAWVVEAYARGVDPDEEHSLTAGLIFAVDSYTEGKADTDG